MKSPAGPSHKIADLLDGNRDGVRVPNAGATMTDFNRNNQPQISQPRAAAAKQPISRSARPKHPLIRHRLAEAATPTPLATPQPTSTPWPAEPRSAPEAMPRPHQRRHKEEPGSRRSRNKAAVLPSKDALELSSIHGQVHQFRGFVDRFGGKHGQSGIMPTLCIRSLCHAATGREVEPDHWWFRLSQEWSELGLQPGDEVLFTAKVHHRTKGFVDQVLSKKYEGRVRQKVTGFGGNLRSVALIRRAQRPLDRELELRHKLKERELQMSKELKEWEQQLSQQLKKRELEFSRGLNVQERQMTQELKRRELQMNQDLQEQEQWICEVERMYRSLEGRIGHMAHDLSRQKRRALVAMACALGIGFTGGGVLSWRLAGSGSVGAAPGGSPAAEEVLGPNRNDRSGNPSLAQGQ